jgi:DNA-binding SARP family transcriptional activator
MKHPGDDPSSSAPTGGTIELALIGGFELRRATLPCAVPHCCERILAYLAIAGRPVERGRLAGVLWGDKTQDRATANLRSALWRLRKAGVEVLVDSGPRLALDPLVRVDVDERERWAEMLCRGEDDLDGIDVDVLVAGLGNELLPDWYDDWVLMERERVRQRTLHATEHLVDALVEAGAYDRAIDVGHRAIRLEPLRESTHRAVVRAHLAEGNRGEALRHVDRCRDLFRRDLGFDVGPTLLTDFERHATAPAPALAAS